MVPLCSTEITFKNKVPAGIFSVGYHKVPAGIFSVGFFFPIYISKGT
jgi:hypothetical protein